MKVILCHHQPEIMDPERGAVASQLSYARSLMIGILHLTTTSQSQIISLLAMEMSHPF